MRIKLILDPSAGGGKGRRFFPQIRKILGKGNLLDFSFTKGPGDAVLLTQEAVRKKHDIIVAACGDGTLNEIINGLLKEGNNIPLGFVPLGMSNTAAWGMGVPPDPIRACEVILQRKVKRIDLGKVVKPVQRYFLSMIDYGCTAALVQRVESRYDAKLFWLKAILGRLLYWIYAYPELFRYPFPKLSIETDGIKHQGYGIIVSNSGFYTGKLRLAPQIKIDDGYLDVCIFKNRGRLNWGLQRYYLALFLGRLHTFPGVEFYSAKKVNISSSTKVPGQIDGDGFGFTPVEMQIAPQILPVIVP